MTSGQIVMVLIMTMTPVHVHDTGHSLATVGFVISAHTLGMYALSPLSARLVDRLGAIPVMLGGFGLLLIAAVLAAIPATPRFPCSPWASSCWVTAGTWAWWPEAACWRSARTWRSGFGSRVSPMSSSGPPARSPASRPGCSSISRGYAALSLVAGALLAIPALAIAAGRSSLRTEAAAERAA